MDLGQIFLEPTLNDRESLSEYNDVVFLCVKENMYDNLWYEGLNFGSLHTV